MKASVKIMRSYDYCHFEVQLSSDEDMDLDQINEMRKEAALLVDESVRQYKIAKHKETSRERNEFRVRQALDRMEEMKRKPESELTPEEAAFLRVQADEEFWKEWREDEYYYEEDGGREHHFSMLRKFQDTRVKA